MKLGFTGTRNGMTDMQRETVFSLIRELDPDEFHHGDCIGADAEAARFCVRISDVFSSSPYRIFVVSRPCDMLDMRAFIQAVRIHRPEPPLDRNKKIVDETDELLAAPGEMFERWRSGTWSTVRYARKQGRPVTIVFPDGSVEKG